jgi:hypothetical protein
MVAALWLSHAQYFIVDRRNSLSVPGIKIPFGAAGPVPAGIGAE